MRSELPTGKTGEVLRWKITPNAEKDWLYAPVVQTSQIGYLPNQPKRAIIETDRRDNSITEAKLLKITADGEMPVLAQKHKAL